MKNLSLFTDEMTICCLVELLKHENFIFLPKVSLKNQKHCFSLNILSIVFIFLETWPQKEARIKQSSASIVFAQDN